MSPTVFRYKNYRFFFFSREEKRMHVHVVSPDGQAKFWLEPVIALHSYAGLKDRAIRELQGLVEDHRHEIIQAWKKHFES